MWRPEKCLPRLWASGRRHKKDDLRRRGGSMGRACAVVDASLALAAVAALADHGFALAAALLTRSVAEVHVVGA